MSAETYEYMEVRSLICDFCKRAIQTDEAFYESKAYRIFAKDAVDYCGDDSAVLSCERCEVIRMRAVSHR